MAVFELLTPAFETRQRIPPKHTAAGSLREGESAPVEGKNAFGRVGWRGPCPPPGHGPHRYVFRLHALEGELDVRRISVLQVAKSTLGCNNCPPLRLQRRS